MKKSRPLTILFICLSLFSLTTKADYDNNNGQGHAYGHDKHPKEGKKVPIDGGIGFLIAAGAALGAKKVLQRNKKNISKI